jgi:CheY-like chemotaxis protein
MGVSWLAGAYGMKSGGNMRSTLYTDILIVSSNPFFQSTFSQFIQPKYASLSCLDEDDACVFYQANLEKIGVIVVDQAFQTLEESASFLSELKMIGHAEVVFCRHEAVDRDVDVQAIVHLTKLGAYSFIIWPSFQEMVVWHLDRAMNFFKIKIDLLTQAEDRGCSVRTLAFFEQLTKRNQQGNLLSSQEIALFFPEDPSQMLPLDQVLEQLDHCAAINPIDVQVLIADDESRIRDYVDMTLEPIGYTLHEAASGKEVLKIMENLSIDVLLLDIALGDYTGSELISQIKSSHPETEVIMLTAYNDIDLISQTVRDGAFDYVVKGVQQSFLPQKIASALQRRQFEHLLTPYLATRENA